MITDLHQVITKKPLLNILFHLQWNHRHHKSVQNHLIIYKYFYKATQKYTQDVEETLEYKVLQKCINKYGGWFMLDIIMKFHDPNLGGQSEYTKKKTV